MAIKINVVDVPWYEVESSNVRRLRWVPVDVTPRCVYGTLTVEYSWGGTYEYYRVSSQRFGRLLAAESVGSYINSRLKPNYIATEVT